jgi:hypothetical protein
MIFFDQAECAKIPIWENKRRIKTLTLFRHLYIDRMNRNGSRGSSLDHQLAGGQLRLAYRKEA